MAAPKIPTKLNVKATPVDSIPVTLVGKDYSVKPPKNWLSMRLAVAAKTADDDPAMIMAALEGWLTAALGKAQGKRVLARLDDADDDLDLEHIMELVESVTEAQAGDRPTS